MAPVGLALRVRPQPLRTTIFEELAMSVRIITSRSIHQTKLADWQRVSDPAHDWLMHPGLLAAAEASMGPGTAGALASGCATHFWYLLAYQDETPIGAACVTEYPLDTMVFASRLAQWVVSHVRRLLPHYLKFRVTFCGLPISIAGSNIRVSPGLDRTEVVCALNKAVEQIARERKTWLVIYKELDEKEATLIAPLASADFVRANSLPMNRIINRFDNFATMLSEMRSHYRYKISRSRKKFANSGLTLTRTTGPTEIEHLYTPDLHAMYESVTLRADHRLEVLPREFFLELIARFPNEVVLTTIHQGERVLAFAWSIRHGGTYRNLFVGIDYEMNEETDAYFNLIVEDIASALERPVDEVYVGQSADDFKSRLGCTADPRYIFIKVIPAWLRWWFRRFQSSLLTPIPPPPARDVFKHDEKTLQVSS